MNKKKHNKKALVVDSSGIYPWLFSIKERDITPDVLDTFLRNIEADYFLSVGAQHEFSTAGYTSQLSLLDAPLNVGSGVQNYNAVYLSDVGYCTTTVNSRIPITPSELGGTTERQNLWETSRKWYSLSEEDRSILRTARGLTAQYNSVAILTNDWNLRQQSTRYEGIEARGTCSMLASLSLGGYISYQRGTYIFEKWLTEEPRWIPTFHPELRKFTFREVLNSERKKLKQGKSFWSIK